MSIFRSEEMTLCQMLLHKESAFDCLVDLGYLGLVQFINTIEASVKDMKFFSEVTRCSAMQNIILHLEEEIKKCEYHVIYYPDVDIEEIPKAENLGEIEVVVQKIDTELKRVEENISALETKKSFLQEKLHVLLKFDDFIKSNTEALLAVTDSIIMNLIWDEIRGSGNSHYSHLRFFAGTIPAERFHAFEVVLWRLYHSNCFLRYGEIPVLFESPTAKGVKVRKYAFIVFFVSEALRGKIQKVCQGFNVSLFDCSASYEERQNERSQLSGEIEDLTLILQQTYELRRHILLVASWDLFIWKIKVKKMFLVYKTLNSLGIVPKLQHKKYLSADCWIPTEQIPLVRKALMRGATRASRGTSGMFFPPIVVEKKTRRKRKPPTFIRSNKFTRGFQHLIDSYGIATYKELNPAPYTIITFPFLFAVMFGDVGHGILVTIFGAYMVLNEKKLQKRNEMQATSNEIWDLLFAGRYIILLMGLFSMYTGAIYNDIFSRAFNFFGSSWRADYPKSLVAESHELELDPANPKHYLGTPYVFGVDPVWAASGHHAIINSNSLKMKMAVILGVLQMIFGLCLSAWNSIYFQTFHELYLVLLPQLIFFLSLFFYLVFLIFFKWATYGGHIEHPNDAGCAPSILITFIAMVLMGKVTALEGCEPLMFEEQSIVQTFMLIFAFASIPVLLLGKPLHFMIQRKKIAKMQNEEAKTNLARDTLDHMRKSLIYSVEFLQAAYEDDDDEELDLSEVWIHQGIHCIESVLGSVSHTASYLRLWALSLAHAQLSEVLWRMVLAMGLNTDRGYMNSVVLFALFWFWAILTVAILVVMEGLSAFLHTLRLHWVEFQSKFYTGDGHRFAPFCFETSRMSDLL